MASVARALCPNVSSALVEVPVVKKCGKSGTNPALVLRDVWKFTQLLKFTQDGQRKDACGSLLL